MNPIPTYNFKKNSRKVDPNLNILKILIFKIHTRETNLDLNVIFRLYVKAIIILWFN